MNNIINIYNDYNYISKNSHTKTMHFKGDAQARIAYALLAKESPSEVLLEAAFSGDFDTVREVGATILHKLKKNAEANKTTISLVEKRLTHLNELQKVEGQQLKEKAIYEILSIEEPEEFERAVCHFLFRGGKLSEIPLFLLDQNHLLAEEGFSEGNSELRFLFEQACKAVHIGRNRQQKKEYSYKQIFYNTFWKGFGYDDESLAVQYLLKILEKTDTKYLLQKSVVDPHLELASDLGFNPLAGRTELLQISVSSFTDPLVLEAACTLGIKPLAELYLEYNTISSIDIHEFLSIAKKLENGIERNIEILDLLVEKLNYKSIPTTNGWHSIRSLHSMMKDFHLSYALIEQTLIKALQSSPDLMKNNDIPKYVLQLACTYNMHRLFEYLFFDLKKFDPISSFETILDYALCHLGNNSAFRKGESIISCLCEKNKENPDFLKRVGSFLLTKHKQQPHNWGIKELLNELLDYENFEILKILANKPIEDLQSLSSVVSTMKGDFRVAFIEKSLIKFLKSSPQLMDDPAISNYVLKQAYDRDMPNLLEYLIFDAKKFDLMDVTLISHIIDERQSECFSLLCKKNKENPAFLDLVGSLLLSKQCLHYYSNSKRLDLIERYWFSLFFGTLRIHTKFKIEELFAERLDSMHIDDVDSFRCLCLIMHDNHLPIEFKEQTLIKLLQSQSSPHLMDDPAIWNYALKEACDYDMPNLFEYLVFDVKKFEFTTVLDLIRTEVIEKEKQRCISLLWEKGKENPDIFNQVGSLLLNGPYLPLLLQFLDIFQEYGIKELLVKNFGQAAENLWPLIQDASKMTDPLVRKEKMEWVLKLLMSLRGIKIPEEEISANYVLLSSLYNHRNPETREEITKIFLSLYDKGNEEFLEVWKTIRTKLKSEINTEKKKVWMIPGLLLVPYLTKDQPTQDETYKAFMKSKSDMFDGKKLDALAQALLTLKDKMEMKNAKNWLQLSLGAKSKEERMKQAIFLTTICNMGMGKLVENLDSFEKAREQMKISFIQSFDLQSINDLDKKYNDTLETLRNPSALLTYQSTLFKGLSKIEYNGLHPLLSQFVKGIIEGTYPHIRYQSSEHLTTVFKGHRKLFSEWKKGEKIKAKDLYQAAPNAKERYNPEWEVIDTDNAEDMLLMGTEVQKSCQKITYEASKSKCLINYIMDGKNRLIAVKDSDGRLIGRCVIRILWDPVAKKSVVFRETLYVNNNNPNVVALIQAMCIRRAEAFGQTLVTTDLIHPEVGIRYPSELKSLSMRSSEYVDALQGIQDFPYAIQGAKVIYCPDVSNTEMT